MRKRKAIITEPPSVGQLRAELRREQRAVRCRQLMWSAFCVLAATAAVRIAVLVLSVLQIYGTSMNPTLMEGDILIAVKGAGFQQGDLICFNLEDKILVKRYIAGPGQWVDIDKEGEVYVDGIRLDEPYLTERALGKCDIQLPYQIPNGTIFVMGDQRSASVDSRSAAVGCVADEQIFGKVVFRVWPLAKFGIVK